MAQPVPDGDTYADVGPPGPALARSGPRRRTVVLVAGLAVAVVLAGGLVPGLALRPLPDPAPAPGLLDRQGFEAVRLGQGFSECRAAGGPGGPCGGSSRSATAFDSEHRCTRYEGPVQDGRVVSVWTRGGTVVVVAVTHRPGGGEVRTWPGPALGAPMAPRPPELQRFEADPRTPAVDYRIEVDDVTTTLADTDGDGRVDTAVVAVTDGTVCRPDRPSSAA